MNDTILTAAEVEAMVAEYPKIYVEHTTACWQWHPECALARLAASHLALLREREEWKDRYIALHRATRQLTDAIEAT